MTVYITGGAGFIGSNLIKYIVEERDWTVYSFDDYSSGSSDNHVNSDRVFYFHLSTADFYRATPESLSADSPQYVFHLGEYSRIVPSFDNVAKCLNSNLSGTWKVVEFCRQHNAKLIYAASSSVFGNNGEDRHLSPYAWTKSANIELIKNYGKWFGMKSAITYFFNVYGDSNIRTGEYSTVIGIFQQAVLDKKPLPVVMPGTQTRDFTHVDDIVRGIVLAAENGDDPEGFHLGYGKQRTILEIAQAFEHYMVRIPERKGERISGQALRTGAAQDQLGWKAEIDVLDYIQQWKANYFRDNDEPLHTES